MVNREWKGAITLSKVPLFLQILHVTNDEDLVTEVHRRSRNWYVKFYPYLSVDRAK